MILQQRVKCEPRATREDQKSERKRNVGKTKIISVGIKRARNSLEPIRQ